MPLKPCPNCGNQISDQAEKCPNCDAIITDNASPRAAGHRQPSIWVILAIILSIGALILCGGIAFYIYNQKSTPQTEQTGSTTANQQQTSSDKDRQLPIATPATEENATESEETTDETTENITVRPLTQFSLVEIHKGIGVSFRSNLNSVLQNLGFTTKTFNRPANMDDMTPFTTLKATRQGNGGTTKIELRDGEDNLCTIDFANQTEVDNFVQSMLDSGYSKDGNIYSHPSNDLSQIYVKVTGLRAKIIRPFEGLPYDF